MAIKIGSNFTFQGQQPNFERDRFATKAAMKAFPETSIDDGHLSYCAEDGNTYQFKSSNGVDNVTGKWRVFKDGFSADTISAEPNQFLAGPTNTRGNIGLRKIDISDIPDLRSKYQVIDDGGYQIYPRIAGARLRAREIDGVMRYLLVDIVNPPTAKISPDWYFATDGTIQDIKTKIPKIITQTFADCVSKYYFH